MKKIRWQVWFLITFIICAASTVYFSLGANDRGLAQAESNWKYAVSQGASSLADYCAKQNVPLDKSLETNVGIFNAENPLICAPTLEEAKVAYITEAQYEAKDISTNITFGFIGVWVFLILAAGLLTKMAEKRAQEQAEREGED